MLSKKQMISSLRWYSEAWHYVSLGLPETTTPDLFVAFLPLYVSMPADYDKETMVWGMVKTSGPDGMLMWLYLRQTQV